MAEVGGEFTITGMGGDEPLDEAGVRVTHARGEQAFRGGIEGTGAVDWLMCYRPDKTADFVGVQRIRGTLDGRRGSLVLTSSGRHDGRTSHGAWSIVAGSGTDELDGISGAGSWEAGPGPEARYRLSYELG